MENTLNNIKAWDLYHAYGKFNISYEGLIDSVRDCIRDILHKYYNTGSENLLHRNYTSQLGMHQDEVLELN